MNFSFLLFLYDKNIDEIYQIYFSKSILSATCFPIAPITPPPGWALLPQIQIPPTLPLNLLVKRF